MSSRVVSCLRFRNKQITMLEKIKIVQCLLGTILLTHILISEMIKKLRNIRYKN